MIAYEEDWIFPIIFKSKGSVMCRALYFAIPAALLAVGLLVLDDAYPDLREKIDLEDLGGSTLWSATTAALIFMVGFRTNRGFQRFWEGAGLLHQMRGEWFDTVSNCVSFSIKASRDESKAAGVFEFRHTVVRLMSLAHGYALEEISGNQFEMTTIDVHGLDRGTRKYLKEGNEVCGFNKVEMTLHLMQSLIINAHNDGILDVPPPILSRVFQTISRGFVHLLNTKKITDTKFPFPYVQLISFLLYAATLFTPMLLTSLVTNKVAAAVLAFLPTFAMACLNYIAIEIENPFGRDDNDLPMDHFQHEMDSCLLMLLHPFADLVPHAGHDCQFEFRGLFGAYGGVPSPEGEGECDKQDKEAKLKRWDTKLLRTTSQIREAMEKAGGFAKEKKAEAKDNSKVVDSTSDDDKKTQVPASSLSRKCADCGVSYHPLSETDSQLCADCSLKVASKRVSLRQQASPSVGAPLAHKDSEKSAPLDNDGLQASCPGVMYLQIGRPDDQLAPNSNSSQSASRLDGASISPQYCNVHLRIDGIHDLSSRNSLGGSLIAISSEVPIHSTLGGPMRRASTPKTIPEEDAKKTPGSSWTSPITCNE